MTAGVELRRQLWAVSREPEAVGPCHPPPFAALHSINTDIINIVTIKCKRIPHAPRPQAVTRLRAPPRRARAPAPAREELVDRELAAEVGIRPTSISLISEIERGLRAPSLEVATKLALALGIPAEPLLDWAHTRRSPRSVEQVRAERSRYRSEELPRLEESMRTAPSLWDERRMALTGPLAEWGPGSAGSVAGLTPESPDDVPVYGPATDPDGRAARPVAYIPRRRLPTSLAEALVRPVAFVVSDEDFDSPPASGLRHPASALRRRHAPADPHDRSARTVCRPAPGPGQARVRRVGRPRVAHPAAARERPLRQRVSRGPARPRASAGWAGSGDARVGVRCSFPVSRTTGLPTG